MSHSMLWSQKLLHHTEKKNLYEEEAKPQAFDLHDAHLVTHSKHN